MLRRSFRINYKGFKNEFSDVFRNTLTDVSKTKFPPQSLYTEDKFLDDDPGLAFAFSRLQKISLMANHHHICNRIGHIKIWHQMRFLQDPPSAKNQPTSWHLIQITSQVFSASTTTLGNVKSFGCDPHGSTSLPLCHMQFIHKCHMQLTHWNWSPNKGTDRKWDKP